MLLNADGVFLLRALLRVPARLDTRRRTREGYLRADAALVRASIHPFTGSELSDLPEVDPAKQYGVLIDDNVVFAPETIDSARMKPVTLGHPTDDVTVDNYANLAVGHIGDDVRKLDDDRLGASIVLTSPTAIAAVERGMEETSVGFYGDIQPVQGEQDYQYRISGPLEVNHLAIVDQGRGGPTVRIFNEERNSMTDEQLKALINEAVAEAMPTGDGDEETKNDESPGIDVGALTTTIAAKLAELNSDADDKDDETAKDEAIREAAAARARLIVNAAPLLPKDTDPHAMTEREIVVAALGDSIEPEGKSDEYLRGQLDAMVASRGRATDERRRIANGGKQQSTESTFVEAAAPRNFLEMRAAAAAKRS